MSQYQFDTAIPRLYLEQLLLFEARLRSIGWVATQQHGI